MTLDPCSLTDIEADVDSLIDQVALDQGIDPICSRTDWTIPVATAFSADAEPRVFSGASGHVLMLEHATPNGPLLTGFDAVWGFATPLIPKDPAGLVDDFATITKSLDFYALSIAGVDTAAPLFGELMGLGPAGFTDTADRCIADLDLGFEAWLGRRSPRFRRSLHAAVHRGDSAGMGIEHLAPTTAADLTACFERLLDVEKRSWKSDAGSGLVDTDLGFFTQLMSRRFAARGALRFTFAQLGGRDIGYVIGARHGTRYRGFQHSFDQAHPELSIGKVLQFHNISSLATEGVHTYDMGMHMAYKESYADRVESTITLIFTKKPKY